MGERRGTTQRLMGPVVRSNVSSDEIEVLNRIVDEPVYKETTEPLASVSWRERLASKALKSSGGFARIGSTVNATITTTRFIGRLARRVVKPPSTPVPTAVFPEFPEKEMAARNWKDGLFGTKVPFRTRPLVPRSLPIPEDEEEKRLFYQLCLAVEGKRRDTTFRSMLANKARALRESDPEWKDLSDGEWYKIYCAVAPIVMLQTPMDEVMEFALREYGEIGIDRTNLLQQGAIVKDPTLTQRFLRVLFPRSVERARLRDPVAVLPPPR